MRCVTSYYIVLSYFGELIYLYLLERFRSFLTCASEVCLSINPFLRSDQTCALHQSISSLRLIKLRACGTKHFDVTDHQNQANTTNCWPSAGISWISAYKYKRPLKEVELGTESERKRKLSPCRVLSLIGCPAYQNSAVSIISNSYIFQHDCLQDLLPGHFLTSFVAPEGCPSSQIKYKPHSKRSSGNWGRLCVRGSEGEGEGRGLTCPLRQSEGLVT
jgi:hypothetical protein